MAHRNRQVARIYVVLNLLENRVDGLTVEEVYQRLREGDHQAEKRTIYRDLEALQSAGFPLVQHRTEDGGSRWKLDRTTKIGQYLVLTPREVMGLYLARQVLRPLRDTPFYADLAKLFQKIEDKLGDKNQEYLAEIGSDFHFEPGPTWGLGITPETIDSVRAACAEGQLLRCHYTSASSGSSKERTLGPHYLYFSKGALYLVAEDLKDHQVKTFSLSRMRDAVMMNETYEGEKTNPESFFENTIGVFRGDGEPVFVKLCFSPKISPFAKERRWHHSQQVINRQGGVVELHFQLALSPELVNWVLGFGPEVTVLEPAALRAEVEAAAKKIATIYEKRLRRVG